MYAKKNQKIIIIEALDATFVILTIKCVMMKRSI